MSGEHPLSPGTPQRQASGTLSEIESSTRAFKAYMLLQEYKMLRNQIPAGMYIAPAKDNMFLWHGVVFPRKGPYATGIFKFLLKIPVRFPDSRPVVYFKTPLYHPLVDDQGQLDMDPQFADWPNTTPFIAAILNYIKKVFTRPQLWEPNSGSRAFNHEAWTFTQLNLPEFLQRAHASVIASLGSVYTHDGPTAPFHFSRFNAAHEQVLRDVLSSATDANPTAGGNGAAGAASVGAGLGGLLSPASSNSGVLSPPTPSRAASNSLNSNSLNNNSLSSNGSVSASNCDSVNISHSGSFADYISPATRAGAAAASVPIAMSPLASSLSLGAIHSAGGGAVCMDLFGGSLESLPTPTVDGGGNNLSAAADAGGAQTQLSANNEQGQADADPFAAFAAESSSSL